jgi:hypothetical protein
MNIRSLSFAVTGFLAISTSLDADELRIESRVLTGKEDAATPGATFTFFHHGVVYDFLSDPKETAILRQEDREFRLLQPELGVQTRVPLDAVNAFCDRLRGWAAQQSDPFLRFAAEPEFEFRFDESTGELTASHEMLTYVAKTVSPDETNLCQQWAEFSDWYAKLNAYTRPSLLPPFPRMALNQELVLRQRLPESIEITIPARKLFGDRQIHFRTEHKLFWRLLEDDLRKIRRAQEEMAGLRMVDWTEYQRLASQSTKSNQDQ